MLWRFKNKKGKKKNTFSSPQPLTPPSPDLQWALPWAAPTHMHIRSIIRVCVWARMIHRRGDVRGRWWRWGSSGHPSSAANMRIFVNASHHPLLFVSKILLHSAASKHIYPPGICPVWGQEKLYNARSLSETRQEMYYQKTSTMGSPDVPVLNHHIRRVLTLWECKNPF